MILYTVRSCGLFSSYAALIKTENQIKIMSHDFHKHFRGRIRISADCIFLALHDIYISVLFHVLHV